MVVHTTATKTSPLQSLLFRENGKQTKDNRDTRIKLDAHETMADSVGDIFEVHSSALDEDTDGDNSIEGLLGACRVARARHLGSGGGQEVSGADSLDGGVGLELGGGVEAGNVVLVKAIAVDTVYSIEYAVCDMDRVSCV